MTSAIFYTNRTDTAKNFTLSLHDALPISSITSARARALFASTLALPAADVLDPPGQINRDDALGARSEEHTSELQSPCNLVCRLLLEKKNHRLFRKLIESIPRRDCRQC